MNLVESLLQRRAVLAAQVKSDPLADIDRELATAKVAQDAAASKARDAALADLRKKEYAAARAIDKALEPALAMYSELADIHRAIVGLSDWPLCTRPELDVIFLLQKNRAAIASLSNPPAKL